MRSRFPTVVAVLLTMAIGARSSWMPLSAVLGDHDHVLSWDHEHGHAALVLAHAVDHGDAHEHHSAKEPRPVVSPDPGDPSSHPFSIGVSEMIGWLARSELGGRTTLEEPLAIERATRIATLHELHRARVRSAASPPPRRPPRTVILLI